MELSEVVTPHFAVPVVGVVICAVLVFAFGFKSPVQPPSFEFIEDDRKAKKSKHRERSKKASHSNGHAIEVETSSKEVTAPVKTVPSVKQRSSPNPSTDKSEAAATKAKKKSNTQLQKTVQTPETIQKEDNDGEWTTAVPKKKKQKNRKDEEVDSHIISEVEDVNASPAVPKKEVKPEQQPLDQREKRKSSKSQSTKVADKENAAPDAPAVSQKPDTNEDLKKKNRKKKVGAESNENIMEPVTNEKSLDVSLSQPGKQDNDEWNTNSPKKKPKKPKNESELIKDIVPKKDEDVKEAVKTSSSPEPAPTGDSTVVVNESTSDVAESSKSTQPNLTFDELGSWEEAKPVKKKKTKSRRDN